MWLVNKIIICLLIQPYSSNPTPSSFSCAKRQAEPCSKDKNQSNSISIDSPLIFSPYNAFADCSHIPNARLAITSFCPTIKPFNFEASAKFPVKPNNQNGSILFQWSGNRYVRVELQNHGRGWLSRNRIFSRGLIALLLKEWIVSIWSLKKCNFP